MQSKNFTAIVAVICFFMSYNLRCAPRSWYEDAYLKLTHNYAEYFGGRDYQSIDGI